MCLTYVWTKEKIRTWLAKQPEMITAYKMALIREDNEEVNAIERLFPPYYDEHGPYKKENEVIDCRPTDGAYLKNKWRKKNCIDRDHYTSYFYLFLRRKDTEAFLKEAVAGRRGKRVIIECQIPKHMVCTIGLQETKLFSYGVCIISRGFNIVGQDDKYFEGL